MDTKVRRLGFVLAGLVVLAMVSVVAVFFLQRNTADDAGAVALRYNEALDTRDLATANSLLSSKSNPWDLNTPATRLGTRCMGRTVEAVVLTYPMADVTLSCTNRLQGPTYIMFYEEEGGWKVFDFVN